MSQYPQPQQPPQWPPPPGAVPTMHPFHYMQAQQQAPMVQWERRQVYYPEPPIPVSPYIAVQPRYRVLDTIVGAAAGTALPITVQFDIPSICYGLTGTSVLTTGAALPCDSRDSFLIQTEFSTGDRFITADTLGSTMLGYGDSPALLGGCGWIFDGGTSARWTITPLLANLRISLVMWCVEVRGPANYVIPAQQK